MVLHAAVRAAWSSFLDGAHAMPAGQGLLPSTPSIWLSRACGMCGVIQSLSGFALCSPHRPIAELPAPTPVDTFIARCVVYPTRTLPHTQCVCVLRAVSCMHRASCVVCRTSCIVPCTCEFSRACKHAIVCLYERAYIHATMCLYECLVCVLHLLLAAASHGDFEMRDPVSEDDV